MAVAARFLEVRELKRPPKKKRVILAPMHDDETKQRAIELGVDLLDLQLRIQNAEARIEAIESVFLAQIEAVAQSIGALVPTPSEQPSIDEIQAASRRDAAGSNDTTRRLAIEPSAEQLAAMRVELGDELLATLRLVIPAGLPAVRLHVDQLLSLGMVARVFDGARPRVFRTALGDLVAG